VPVAPRSVGAVFVSGTSYLLVATPQGIWHSSILGLGESRARGPGFRHFIQAVCASSSTGRRLYIIASAALTVAFAVGRG